MSLDKQILRDWSCERNNHREDFTSCPGCDMQYSNEEWDNLAAILVLDEMYGKHGSIVIVSECDVCFEKSWVHHWLIGFFDQFPEDWQQAIAKEYKDRKDVVDRSWNKSLCKTCKNGKRVDEDTLDWVKCEIKTPKHTRSFTANARTECKDYKVNRKKS